MNKNKPQLFVIVLLIQAFILSSSSLAHEGHDEGVPSAGNVVGGKITLTDEAIENIGLKVQEVEERSIDEVVICNGFVITHPNKTAQVSSRISGRVMKLLVNIGEDVQENQDLIEIESRQIGNPPPIVKIKSPISGTVIHRDVTLGETVEPDKHLFEIAELKNVLVKCGVYEKDLSKVKIGQKVRVTLPVAYPNELFMGDITYISPVLDLETRTTYIWIRVPNRDKRLKPGILAQAAIIIKQRTRVVAIPKEAVTEEGGEKFVYLEEGKNTYTRQSVVLGISNDKDVEIKKGLIPFDRIVISGNYELRITELTALRTQTTEDKKTK